MVYLFVTVYIANSGTLASLQTISYRNIIIMTMNLRIGIFDCFHYERYHVIADKSVYRISLQIDNRRNSLIIRGCVLSNMTLVANCCHRTKIILCLRISSRSLSVQTSASVLTKCGAGGTFIFMPLPFLLLHTQAPHLAGISMNEIKLSAF